MNLNQAEIEAMTLTIADALYESNPENLDIDTVSGVLFVRLNSVQNIAIARRESQSDSLVTSLTVQSYHPDFYGFEDHRKVFFRAASEHLKDESRFLPDESFAIVSEDTMKKLETFRLRSFDAIKVQGEAMKKLDESLSPIMKDLHYLVDTRVKNFGSR